MVAAGLGSSAGVRRFAQPWPNGCGSFANRVRPVCRAGLVMRVRARVTPLPIAPAAGQLTRILFLAVCLLPRSTGTVGRSGRTPPAGPAERTIVCRRAGARGGVSLAFETCMGLRGFGLGRVSRPASQTLCLMMPAGQALSEVSACPLSSNPNCMIGSLALNFGEGSFTRLAEEWSEFRPNGRPWLSD
jgi:hypothetical protein